METSFKYFWSPNKLQFYGRYMLKEPKKSLARAREKFEQAFSGPRPCWAPGAIADLSKLINKSWTIGEFGSGHSSLWLSERAGNVWSVEDDRKWFNLISTKAPPNLNLLYAEPGARDAYVGALSDALPAQKLDLLIIDGKYRDRCAAVAHNLVKPSGFVLVDDTMRTEYEPFLTQLGTRVWRHHNSIRMTDLYQL